ncbi:CLUMA_CG003046, isoform A [Clunio marinus]|uniref:CLUMA_CG003046, isoform A n=1 Tax=Clunio marinus TaxID=568069 RepID=A0A1J1HMK6_9DIPT|nr:CLUMA_CG003046, isoform A [Clunio marinus]
MVMGMMRIGELKTRRILFQKLKSKEKISGVLLDFLVDINDTRSERSSINQNVRFTEDLNVNRLFVIYKKNQQHNVRNGKFQVMRKRGPEMQIVTGEKFFDNVNLKSPILLRGKIESQTLQRMNPISTINKDLVPESDYTITGPVNQINQKCFKYN